MAPQVNRAIRAAAGLLVTATLALAAGCKGEPAYGEVEGVVTLDGRPLPNAEVIFLPDPEKGNTGRRSVALTDAQGRYRVASDGGRAGAPVGFHRVCVNDLTARPGAAAVVREESGVGPAGTAEAPPPRPGRSRFPAEYGSAAATPLRDIEVKPGAQTINLPVQREPPR